MTSKLEMIKTLFDEFLLESKGETVHVDRMKDKMALNADVFELQSHIISKLKEHKLNLTLNPQFVSKHIKNSFQHSVGAIKQDDYCLCFLDFLCVNQDRDIELVELIKEFINLHIEELTWQDIVITATGVTRCLTNIRFALNHLRDWNLIVKGERTYVPTPFGEMVFYQFRKEKGLPVFDVEKEVNEQPVHDPNKYQALQIAKLRFAELFKLISKFSSTAEEGKHLLNSFKLYKKWQGDSAEIIEIMRDIEKFINNTWVDHDGVYRYHNEVKNK